MTTKEVEVFCIRETDDYDPDEFEPGWYWRTKRAIDEFLDDDAHGPFNDKTAAIADAIGAGFSVP